MPMIATVPYIVRKMVKRLDKKLHLLPIIALVTAMWSTVMGIAINRSLKGPLVNESIEMFIRVSTGQYLGMLPVILPLLVWLRRDDAANRPRHLSRHVTVAFTFIALLYIAVASGVVDPALRQVLLVMMIAPAIGLTMLHGWRGAAIGVAYVDCVIVVTLPEMAFIGAHDQTTFFAQQLLAVAATALFFFGALISNIYERVRRLGVAEEQAKTMARSSFSFIGTPSTRTGHSAGAGTCARRRRDGNTSSTY